MVFAPGMRNEKMNAPIAIVLTLVGIGLVAGALYGAFHVPAPRILTCEREGSGELACEPGHLRGASAAFRRQSGKNAKDCFVLGQTWLCDGDVNGAVAKANALAPGARTEIDLTPPPAAPSTLVFSGLLGTAMLLVGLRSLTRPSTSRS